MASFLVLHGPNLNLLGTREPEIYGSNAEHILIERIHAAKAEHVDFIIINPAGFTTSSVSLRDALLGVQIPFIEVHLSNIYAREEFRQHSYFSDIAVGIISGLGHQSYTLALSAAIDHSQDK